MVMAVSVVDLCDDRYLCDKRIRLNAVWHLELPSKSKRNFKKMVSISHRTLLAARIHCEHWTIASSRITIYDCAIVKSLKLRSQHFFIDNASLRHNLLLNISFAWQTHCCYNSVSHYGERRQLVSAQTCDTRRKRKRKMLHSNLPSSVYFFAFHLSFVLLDFLCFTSIHRHLHVTPLPPPL